MLGLQQVIGMGRRAHRQGNVVLPAAAAALAITFVDSQINVGILLLPEDKLIVESIRHSVPGYLLVARSCRAKIIARAETLDVDDQHLLVIFKESDNRRCSVWVHLSRHCVVLSPHPPGVSTDTGVIVSQRRLYRRVSALSSPCPEPLQQLPALPAPVLGGRASWQRAA